MTLFSLGFVLGVCIYHAGLGLVRLIAQEARFSKISEEAKARAAAMESGKVRLLEYERVLRATKRRHTL